MTLSRVNLGFDRTLGASVHAAAASKSTRALRMLGLARNREERMTRSFSLFALMLTTTLASATDWPQWMSTHRNDVWAEMGITKQALQT
jgi:hypothetical protein